MVHYFLRISSLSPSPMVSGRGGSSRHVRKPTLGFEKASGYSETADVPPFLLVQIHFSGAGCLAEGCQHHWHPPWRRHCIHMRTSAETAGHRLDTTFGQQAQTYTRGVIPRIHALFEPLVYPYIVFNQPFKSMHYLKNLDPVAKNSETEPLTAPRATWRRDY